MDDQGQSSPYDDLQAALDGAGLSIRDVVSITGFRLDSSRLYLDEGELSWIDVADGGIVHTRVYAEDSMRLGLTTIWVRRDAETVISQIADAEDIAAGFLKPSNMGGDTAPYWYRDLNGFVLPYPIVTRRCPLSGRGPCAYNPSE